MRVSEPESLGGIMAGRPGMSPSIKKLKKELISLHWAHIAGERLASHSTPTRITKGVLTVSAEGPAWAAELSAKTPELLAGVTRVLGDNGIKKMRVRARSPELAPETGVAVKPADHSREAPLGPQLQEKLNGIDEEETRTALERMLRASMERKQYEQNG